MCHSMCLRGHVCVCLDARLRESVLFIGTQFSNLYTAVDTPARGRVVHVRTCTCVRVYACVYVRCTCMYVYVYVSVCTCMSVYVRVCTYVGRDTCVYDCTSVCVYECVRLRTYMHGCTCVFTLSTCSRTHVHCAATRQRLSSGHGSRPACS